MFLMRANIATTMTLERKSELKPGERSKYDSASSHLCRGTERDLCSCWFKRGDSHVEGSPTNPTGRVLSVDTETTD